MSKLHKIIRFPLVYKYYLLFFFIYCFGVYKNGFLPVSQGFYPKNHILLVAFYPIIGYILGFCFDKISHNKCVFNNRFYGVLFSFLLPISTSIYVYLGFLFSFFLLHTVLVSRKDWDFNVLVFFKLLLVGWLYYTKTYSYANLLETSETFVYSFLDGILGFNESGLFTSSVLLTLVSFLVLSFDMYYKKEIPFYSYGVYLLTLAGFAIYKGDMAFLLSHMLSSTILFALVFVATLSSFSPYSRKRKAIYGILIGLLILPCSLYFTFFEGVYFAILFANLVVLFLNGLQRIILK